MVFIVPRPDESAYSLFARAHIQAGNTSPRQTLRQYSGLSGYAPMSCLPSRLSHVSTLLAPTLTPEKWVDRHTFAPALRPFLSPLRYERLISRMCGNGLAKGYLGSSRARVGVDEQLAFCPECNSCSIDIYGHSYWHRSHMVSGVSLCADHARPLMSVNWSFLPWRHRALVEPKEGSPFDVKERQFDKLLFVANEIAGLLNCTVSFHVGCESYLAVLDELGLVTKARRVRGRRIIAAVRRWLKSICAIEPYQSLYGALDIDRPWPISTIVEPGFSHPIRHIVIWGALGIDGGILKSVWRRPGTQMALKLEHTRPCGPTISDFRAIEKDVSSVCEAAKKLGCDVSTALVLADRAGFPYTRRAKSISQSTRDSIACRIESGTITAEIAREFGVSVSTVNRIRRAIQRP